VTDFNQPKTSSCKTVSS